MEIEILAFGQIADIIGKPSLIVSNISSTEQLKEALFQQYPKLKETRFSIAVNKNVVSQDSALSNGDIVALLPPFSGG
ncbi:MAG: MoaD/ThiS family protein [Bacteroidetes bacterium]|nr:MoaD/ThiS family protein [Bacteroidota bacterium]